jgi:hypothetical protein
VFVMHAYFHARRVSVLADYPCYHWILRDADTNASYQPFDPASYYDNVREVLDLVEEHTKPGKLRDRLMRHWYRGKLLGRVGGSAFANRDPEYNRALHAEVRRLALERYGPRDDARLPLRLRLRGHLLRAGTYEGLLALAGHEGELRAAPRLVRAQGDGTWLTFHVEAEITGADGRPLTFRRSGDRLDWIPPRELADELRDAPLDVTDELRSSRVQLLVRGADGTEYQLPVQTEVRLVPAQGEPVGTVRPVLATRGRLAPTIAAAGAPLPAGDWELHALVNVTGFLDEKSVRHGGTPVILRSTPPGRVVWTADPRLESRTTRVKRRLARHAPVLVRVLRRARERRASPVPG